MIRRKFEKKEKTVEKAPKIQRLVTPLTLQRKRARKAVKTAAVEKSKAAASAYARLSAAPAGAEGGAAPAISKRRSSRAAARSGRVGWRIAVSRLVPPKSVWEPRYGLAKPIMCAHVARARR